jgi:hypothetical protein
VPDYRYSTGATVGDYDNDGFPQYRSFDIGKFAASCDDGDVLSPT